MSVFAIDGNLYDLAEEIKLEKNKKHNIEIIVDRLMIKEGIENRLTDSIETVEAYRGTFVSRCCWWGTDEF